VASRSSEVSPLRRGGWIILTCLTGAFFVSSVFENIQINREKAWELVAASVVAQRVTHTCNKGVAFNVELSYAYHLKQATGEGAVVLPVDGCLDAAQIATFTAEHPIGSSISVRVDPNDATQSQSVAELETNRPMALSVFTGIVFFILMVFQLKFLMKYFKY